MAYSKMGTIRWGGGVGGAESAEPGPTKTPTWTRLDQRPDNGSSSTQSFTYARFIH